MSLIKKKICLLGDVGVGKTSLIRRFVDDIFDDSYLSTIGVKVSQKKITLQNAQETLLMIWDIEGFNSKLNMNSNYFIGASGAIVVADLTRLETIDMLGTVIAGFNKINPQATIMLAGNKTDIIKPKHPGNALFRSTVEKLGLTALFTSAKTGENVETCFRKLTQKIISN